MPIFPIGLGRDNWRDKNEKSDQQAFHARAIICNDV
jgi:hypothetical protein